MNTADVEYDTKEDKLNGNYHELLTIEPTNDMLEYNKIKAFALERRFDLQKARQEVVAAQKNLSVVKSQLIPDVEVSAGYGYRTASKGDSGSFENGAYIGGIICPGIMLASKMLRSNTAQLPEVSIKKPASVIGKNTVHHIQSGIYFGYLEMINGLLRRVLKEDFVDEKVNVIITGGLGNDISNDMEFKAVYEPNLTLDGLMMLYKNNI